MMRAKPLCIADAVQRALRADGRWNLLGPSGGSDPKTSPSFALLECFDYAYYGTLDVRFYASLPLLKFWPAIDKQVLREFADTVPREWP